MKVWDWDMNKPIASNAYDKISLRRLYILLNSSRYTPKGLKISRRSRRRWRGKYGGIYMYPTELLNLFNEAKERYEQKHG